MRWSKRLLSGMRRQVALQFQELGARLMIRGSNMHLSLLQERTTLEAEAEGLRVKEAIEAGGDDYMSALPPLTLMDHCLIGQIIQIMNFVDFNARRALEIVDQVHPDGRKTPEPRDNLLLKTLSDRLEGAGLPRDEIVEARRRLGDLIHFQRIRNHLAHWMARRALDADALVVWTKNGREGPRRSGAGEHEAFQTTFGIIPLDEVRKNLPVMIRHHEWLAGHVSHWFARYIDPSDFD